VAIVLVAILFVVGSIASAYACPTSIAASTRRSRSAEPSSSSIVWRGRFSRNWSRGWSAAWCSRSERHALATGW